MTFTTLPDRIRAKVVVDLSTGCWLWQGHIYPNGYGYTHVRVERGKFKAAYVHRFVYELLVGPIENQLDHVRARGCVHRHCCNPGHLEDVTGQENVRRVVEHRDACVNGHPYDEANTRIYRGHRNCRACGRANQVRIKQRRGKEPGPYSDARTCAVCGASFDARQPWQKYCGSDCRKAARRG